MSRSSLPRFVSALLIPIFFCCAILSAWDVASAQEVTDAMLDEMARRSGMSRQEMERLYREQGGQLPEEAEVVQEPGRTSLEDIDDSKPAPPLIILPLEGEPVTPLAGIAVESVAVVDEAPPSRFFGADFFKLDPGVFNPTTFGPVPEDYLIGVGDQIIVDVWGEVEFRLERIVDRDGSIILPKGGKITCFNRTLSQVEGDIRERLSRSYSGLAGRPERATTFLDVSLGSLRAIRVYVVGDAVQPGAYELSSVATVFTVLYAAGGPAETGSMRDIRLMRGSEAVASFDLYRYLLEGKREGDVILREGNTVYIPPRGKTVELRGAVRRPLIFELRAEEGLTALLTFGGGFTTTAAVEVVHIERILPPAMRQPEQPDKTYLDIAIDPVTSLPSDPDQARLIDGDIVSVDAIADRLVNWVEVQGNVKRPGRYEYRPEMTARELVQQAGGLWPDTMQERAIVDRVSPDRTYQSFDFPLGDVMAGRAGPVLLQPMDQVQVFSRWDLEDRSYVVITGDIRQPSQFDYREGMTLRDLILKAGGLKESADLLRAEVSRLKLDVLGSRDLSDRHENTVEVLIVPLGDDFLQTTESFLLQPFDQVALRKLPWWELQRTIVVRGEVYYPGVYSLERPDEKLSDLISRAGGLKPTAFVPGTRIVRAKEGIGNIALDLRKALDKPGSDHDVVLAAGDEIMVPEFTNTVKVIGTVGFPTSIVWEKGKSLGYYVNRAGGYAENADKWKTRVVYPNGMSRPIKKIWKDPEVMAGSTIMVPEKTPKQKGSTMETVRDIFAIAASAATVYWIIVRTD